MQGGVLIFPVTLFASVCMGTWGIGMFYFHRKDNAAGRAPNQPSGYHLLWACLFPVPCVAYVLLNGFPTGIPTSGGIFLQVVIAEFLGAGVIFCCHEAYYGRIGNKGDRVIMGLCGIALVLGSAAFAFLV